jgi:hypothetical protein
MPTYWCVPYRIHHPSDIFRPEGIIGREVGFPFPTEPDLPPPITPDVSCDCA